VSIKIENKEQFKRDVKKLLSKIIEKPNRDISSIMVFYDTSLSSITLRYIHSNIDDPHASCRAILVFDEMVDAEEITG